MEKAEVPSSPPLGQHLSSAQTTGNNSGVWNSKGLRPIPCLRVAVGDGCVVGS